MNDYVSKLDLAIWIILIAGRLFLCLCILKKGLFRRMPWFSIYVLASTIESVLLLSITFLFSYTIYYYAFYTTSHLVSLLAFFVLIECGRRVLPGLNLPQKEKAIALLLLSIGVIVAFAGLWPLHFLENRVELGAHLMVGVTFIFIAVYSRYLGLYWSRLVAGIAACLGLLYLVQGTIRAIAWHYPASIVLLVRQILQLANVLAVIAWIIVVLSPWGESVMTEEDLQILEAAFAKIEGSLGTERIKIV
jgi:hypothetical protein